MTQHGVQARRWRRQWRRRHGRPEGGLSHRARLLQRQRPEGGRPLVLGYSTGSDRRGVVLSGSATP
jgi:hypothetical protein